MRWAAWRTAKLTSPPQRRTRLITISRKRLDPPSLPRARSHRIAIISKMPTAWWGWSDSNQPPECYGMWGVSDQLTLSNTRYRQQPHRSWEAALTGAEAPSGGAVWGEEGCRRAGNTGTSH